MGHQANMRTPRSMMNISRHISFGLMIVGLAVSAWVVGPATSFAQSRVAGPGNLLNEPRVALVIGNSNYASSPLRNPANDAKLMAKSLRDVGFEVIEVVDATQRKMRRAIIDFGDKLEKGGVGLFYYAGHGVQVGGENYLMPIGAEISREAHVGVEGVSVNQVLARMEGARNRLNIVILDACRNNPFGRSFRSAQNGLAQMLAPSGTYIAYATAPGQVAADGNGQNSPFTAAVVNSIKQPNLKLEEAFKQVRVKVKDVSKGNQIPWTSSSIVGNFYFTPPKITATKKNAAPVAAQPAPTPTFDKRQVDLAFWNSVKDSNDPLAYQEYIKQFPSGTFAGLARIKIRQAEQKSAARSQLSAARKAEVAALENARRDAEAARADAAQAARLAAEQRKQLRAEKENAAESAKLATEQRQRLRVEKAEAAEAAKRAAEQRERLRAEQAAAKAAQPEQVARLPGPSGSHTPHAGPESAAVWQSLGSSEQLLLSRYRLNLAKCRLPPKQRAERIREVRQKLVRDGGIFRADARQVQQNARPYVRSFCREIKLASRGSDRKNTKGLAEQIYEQLSPLAKDVLGRLGVNRQACRATISERRARGREVVSQMQAGGFISPEEVRPTMGEIRGYLPRYCEENHGGLNRSP